MARYDYRCTACGKVFEVEHAMRERPAIVCPDCGGAAEKVFNTSGIVFEGHGFYNTDQRDTHTKKTSHAQHTKGNDAKTAPQKTEKKDTPAKKAESTSE